MPDTSPIVVRPCRPEEHAAYFEALRAAFGDELDEATRDAVVQQVGADRLVAAFVADGPRTGPSTDMTRSGATAESGSAGAATGGDGTMAGLTSAYPTTLTIPGGEVPAAAIAGVGVRPTHRRRGVLTAMMRWQLDDERRRGTVAALLWASEPGIYGRFGFGLATWRTVVEIEPDRARFRDVAPPVGTGRAIA